jgi:hypothetical protein
MAPDYWRTMAQDKLPFDNAQNWWRHQVAELGVVASLPVLIWSLLIAWLVLTRRSRPDARIETQTLRGSWSASVWPLCSGCRRRTRSSADLLLRRRTVRDADEYSNRKRVGSNRAG